VGSNPEKAEGEREDKGMSVASTDKRRIFGLKFKTKIQKIQRIFKSKSKKIKVYRKKLNY